ncbi:ABC transporter ATP-binding protein [Pseudothermotoga sp.]|uniref:ABC transporter ATP-binding protein n=1 Tax=Pseudothermotoga sp. TaxID=2033661 RepID=UPI0031F6280B
MENVLEVKGLRTYFELAEGTVKAVDGIDFQLRKGEVLGIVGESGCGKSVTALSIMRILPKSARICDGQILFRNEGNVLDLVKLDANGEEMRRIRGKDISMIFQEPAACFSPVYTVGEQMIEAIVLHEDVSKQEARKLAVKMLDKVKIPNPESVLDRYSFQLSGGMLQRCMIAMALSLNPKVLIADEPTTALDVTIQAQIIYLVKQLQKEYSSSIIWITHDMGVIAQVSDRVAVMYLGHIVETAKVKDLFEDPKHPYTRALLRSIPRLARRKTKLEAIKGVVPDPYNLPTGCRYHDRCDSFMKGLCDREEPSEVEVGQDHRVKCFLYGGK